MCKGAYEIRSGGRTAQVPADLVDERSAPGDAWENKGFVPFPPVQPGQTVPMGEYILECPEGHERRIPVYAKEMDRNSLDCLECRRAYRLIVSEAVQAPLGVW